MLLSNRSARYIRTQRRHQKEGRLCFWVVSQAVWYITTTAVPKGRLCPCFIVCYTSLRKFRFLMRYFEWGLRGFRNCVPNTGMNSRICNWTKSSNNSEKEERLFLRMIYLDFWWWKCEVMSIYKQLRSGPVLATASPITDDIHYWRQPYWSQCQMLFWCFLFRFFFSRTSALPLPNGATIEPL